MQEAQPSLGVHLPKLLAQAERWQALRGEYLGLGHVHLGELHAASTARKVLFKTSSSSLLVSVQISVEPMCSQQAGIFSETRSFSRTCRLHPARTRGCGTSMELALEQSSIW